MSKPNKKSLVTECDFLTSAVCQPCMIVGCLFTGGACYAWNKRLARTNAVMHYIIYMSTASDISTRSCTRCRQFSRKYVTCSADRIMHVMFIYVLCGWLSYWVWSLLILGGGKWQCVFSWIFILIEILNHHHHHHLIIIIIIISSSSIISIIIIYLRYLTVLVFNYISCWAVRYYYAEH